MLDLVALIEVNRGTDIKLAGIMMAGEMLV